MNRQWRKRLDCEVLERRLLLAAQPVVYDLEQNWSDLQNPNGVWSLNEGRNHLPSAGNWQAANQSAWARAALGNQAKPAFLKLSTLAISGAKVGDIVIETADTNSASGPASAVWTSPGGGMATISGNIWDAGTAPADETWTLYDNSIPLSTGTILQNQFSRDRRFNLALGSGGPGALSNVHVNPGDQFKLMVTSTQSEYVGVDFSVAFNSAGIAQYQLGSIPPQIPTSAQPISFFVIPPTANSSPVHMQLNATPFGAASFDPATDLFTYTPDARDKFDFSVLFSAGDTGTWNAPSAQLVTISPSTTPTEVQLVAAPKSLPDPASQDYITVSETLNTLPTGSHFNATARTITRNVEISGKTINFKPGDPSGLFERFAYTDPNGLSAIDADIQNLSVYAETLVIGANLRLPQTDVTIYAQRLVFDDSSGQTARIDTTPLDYQLNASQFQNGVVGENAGNITLHVESVNTPSGAGGQTPNRFILRGGDGQAAGQGEQGQPGQSMPVFSDNYNVWVYSAVTPRFTFTNGFSATWGTHGLPVSFILIGEQLAMSVSPKPNGQLTSVYREVAAHTNGTVVTYSPAPGDNFNFTMTFTSGASKAIITLSPSSTMGSVFRNDSFGTDAWPGDGSPAKPGGTPGQGGSGGMLTGPAGIDLGTLVDVGGGAAGAKAADQLGGEPGTPQASGWSNNLFEVANHTSAAGAGWTAPAGQIGSAGSITSVAPAPGDWLHPSSLLAVLSYAKDAYINGHITEAGQIFSNYARLLESIVSPAPEFASQFAKYQTEIAGLENQTAAGLDYFGNPPGWAPTLSFAANYRAYQNQIDSAIRILFLTRLIQSSAASQQARAAAMTKSLTELDSAIAAAIDQFNSSQTLLPALEHQLDVIAAQTALVQQELANKEQELEARAASNVADRHKSAGWKKALTILSAVAAAVPIPVVSTIGKSLGAITGFLDNPNLQTLENLGSSLSNPFTSDRLKASLQDFKTQFDLLTPPSKVTSASLKDYLNNLNNLGSKWTPVLKAYTDATKATEVPASEIEDELAKLRAEDPTFIALTNEIETLAGQKQAFAQDLARTTQSLSDAVTQVTTDYASADTLNTQLSNLTAGLRHDTLEQARQMERDARDRLLKYQYYMAKAYEYEMLQPYPGNFQLSHLVDAVTAQLANNADATWLDNPTNFASLKAIYENDLNQTADTIWTNLNTNGPQRTSTVSFRLSPDQINTLNTTGQVTLNLVDMGFISPLQQNAKILQIGASQITTTLHGPFAQLANVHFDFDHSGQSIIQSHGQEYAFQHYTSSTETPIFWATDYDAIRGATPVQAGISPSQIASISALLGLDPASVPADEADRMYAHPGAWGDITIHKTVTAVPASVSIDLQEVWISVRYDSDRPQQNTVDLTVRTDDEMSPKILIDKSDFGSHTDGSGDFTRFYNQGQTIMLAAQPNYGQYRFREWQDAAGNRIGTIPTLTLAMTQNKEVHPVYEIAPLPSVSSAVFDPTTSQQIRLSFSSDLRSSLTGDDLHVVNLTTGQTLPASAFNFSVSSTVSNVTTAVWNAIAPLPDGNYRAVLAADSVLDGANQTLASDFTFDFFVLAGDSNHDRSVDFADLVAVAQHYGTSGGVTFTTGDLNYDDKVDFADLVVVAQKYGAALSPLPLAVPVAAPLPAAIGTKSKGDNSPAAKPLFSVSPFVKATPPKPTPQPRARRRRTKAIIMSLDRHTQRGLMFVRACYSA